MDANQNKQIPSAFLYFSRIILVGLFGAVSILQLLSFPGQFRYEASNSQGSQAVRWFLTFMVGFWFLIAQVTIVALWNVLSAIYQRTITTPQGARWMNLLVRALALAAGYGVGVTTIALIFTNDPGPVVVTGTLTSFIFTLYIVGYFVRHQIMRADSLI